jgi:hypothetical protein
MTERRFHEGDRFSIPPMEYRLVRGKKRPKQGDGYDLRLDWRWPPADWRPVELDHVALIIDAIADNEDVLYPPPYFEGGARVFKFVRTAYHHGWAKARADLHVERQHKADPPTTLF